MSFQIQGDDGMDPSREVTSLASLDVSPWFQRLSQTVDKFISKFRAWRPSPTG
jgi:hypothetical protein